LGGEDYGIDDSSGINECGIEGGRREEIYDEDDSGFGDNDNGEEDT
jgi:hypothetical protein